MFIVFEGIDNSGKTTVIDYITNILRSSEYTVYRISFPIRTSLTGQLIDRYLKGKMVMRPSVISKLFYYNRLEYQDMLADLINAYDFVLCDRYIYSGICYTKLSYLDTLESLIKRESNLIIPDIVFHLDVDPYTANNRKYDTNDVTERLDKQIEVYNAYHRLYRSDLFKMIKPKILLYKVDSYNTNTTIDNIMDVINLILQSTASSNH
jgi:dTMP kinase